MPSIAEQLAAAPVTDTLKGSPTEVAWPKLGWANSRGTFSASGWKPPGYSEWPPTHSFGGTYYATPGKSGGDAYVYLNIPVSYSLLSGAEYRSFSVWLFSGGNTAQANGYQLRLRQATSGTGSPKKYIFLLYKFVAGVGTLLAESGEVTIETGGAFALTKVGGKLAMWRREAAASEWVQVGADVEDAAFTEGYAAIDGTGSNPTLADFGAGAIAPVKAFGMFRRIRTPRGGMGGRT
jgi:hypothetical protein